MTSSDRIINAARAFVSKWAARWLFSQELHRMPAPLGRKHPYRVFESKTRDDLIVEAWLFEQMGDHKLGAILRAEADADV